MRALPISVLIAVAGCAPRVVFDRDVGRGDVQGDIVSSDTQSEAATPDTSADSAADAVDEATDAGCTDATPAHCEPTPPRPISPLSASIMTSRRPTLRWQLPVGTTTALVMLCRDRAMSDRCRDEIVTNNTSLAVDRLETGAWFWRLRGRNLAGDGSRTSPVWQFMVTAEDSIRETACNAVSDFNGDGYSDALFGALTDNGRVHYYRGRAGAQGDDATVLTTGLDHPNSNSVDWLGNAGDIDGDGFVDAIIGVPETPMGLAGRIEIHRGGPAGPAATATSMIGGPGGSAGFFGWSVASAGDVNGDGYSDVIVGAPYAAVSGRVHVYFGSPSGLSAARAQAIDPPVGDSLFGRSVAGIGDLDHDGFGDVVIGAPGSESGAGSAVVFLGRASGALVRGARIVGVLPSVQLGMACANVGDVDGDGLCDVVIGAPSYVIDATTTGRAYLYLGSGALAGPAATDFQYANASNFGSAIAGGDMNADGFSDVMIGGRGYGMGLGAVAWFPGSSAGVNPVLGPFVIGDRPNGAFGASLSTGYYNEDLSADLVVGAPLEGTGSGGAYMLLGNTTRGLPLRATTPFTAPAGSNQFGISIAR